MPAVETATQTTPHLGTSDVHFRRILLAIDFSEQTSQVMNLGLEFAGIFDAELYLVNATTPILYTGSEPVPAATFDVNLEIAQTRMAELVGSLPALVKVPHHEIVAYAEATQLLQQVIEDKKIDLVIAGSHGASGMERLALGSVAESILRSVYCPVLIAGRHAQCSKEIFSSILLAASLRPGGFRSAQYATALAEHFHSRLTLLHVVEPHSNNPVHPEILEDRMLAELQSLLPADFASRATASFEIRSGKPGDLIIAVALSLRPTLIVIGARAEHNIASHNPWSTLAELIRLAPCPILCVQGHLT